MRILITRALPGGAAQALEAAPMVSQIDVWQNDEPMPRGELLSRAVGADAIIAIITEQIDEEVLAAAGPSLRIVANMAVGYDNISVAAATARRIPVTNTPGVLTETTADLAFGLLLAAGRRFSESERFLRSGAWKYWSPSLLLGVDIHGKTLGIYGMGRIGQAVARRAVGFGMRVLYTNRNRLPADTESALNAEWVEKDRLLSESDFLSIHAPMSAETRHAFAAAEFAAMKPTAVLVNTARGPLVDEAALAAALQSGQLFAAGLDVFEEEPKVHADLLKCDNVVLLPHLGSASRETRARMAEMAVRNVLARLRGEIPPNCVNPEVLT